MEPTEWNACTSHLLAVPAGKPSLSAAAWKTTASLFITALPFKLANDASQFVGPVFLNLLLSSISRNDPPRKSYMYAVGMFGGLIVGCICEGQYWQRSMRAGFRLRAAVVAAVYRCALLCRRFGGYHLRASTPDLLHSFAPASAVELLA